MNYLKTELLLCSFLLFCSVAYAFDIPVDNPHSNLGLGRRLHRGRSQYVPTFSENGPVHLHSELNGGAGNIKRRSSNLTDLESQSSELNDLYANRSNALVESSTGSSVTTPKTVFFGSPTFKSIVSSVFMPPPRNGFNSNRNTSSSEPLTVPSEGGLMQDSSVVTSVGTRNGTENGDVLPSNGPKELQMNESETGLSTEGTLIHQEDIPVVKKQLPPQDSHISARKGATLPEKSEITSSNIHETTEQFTFSSSESTFSKEIRPQKIAPRKGAELPKIFPRKGVEDKLDDRNTSDSVYSDENVNEPTRTSTDNISTPLTLEPTSKTTPLYKSVLGVSDSVQNGITGTPKLFENTARIDFPQNVSTPSVSSKSSVISSISMSTTPKLEALSDNGVKNIYSNLSVPFTDMKNATEDKSGIIASYPPLKRRLKPLKTTDTHILNSSPPPPEHPSSEHDYIVPIVVTILTIPMLVVLILFLYKKGSEFWERRHYRRMDFLIDGMYND